MAEFEYHIMDDFDNIVDEKGNSFIALRKICWGSKDKGKMKLDIRKWYIDADGNEKIGKGVSFLTEEGPHNLTKVLVDNGYGYTKDILEGIKRRDDFKQSLNSVLEKDNKHYDETVEEEELYVPNDNLFDYE